MAELMLGSDSPDVITKIGVLKIGIEVRRLFNDEKRCGSPSRQRLSTCQAVVESAARIHSQVSDYFIHVSVHFRRGVVIPIRAEIPLPRCLWIWCLSMGSARAIHFTVLNRSPLGVASHADLLYPGHNRLQCPVSTRANVRKSRESFGAGWVLRIHNACGKLDYHLALGDRYCDDHVLKRFYWQLQAG